MNREIRKQINKALEKNPVCYVLITCGQSLENGQMQVEMSYDGDPDLAAYLIQDAQRIMDLEGAEEIELGHHTQR